MPDLTKAILAVLPPKPSEGEGGPASAKDEATAYREAAYKEASKALFDLRNTDDVDSFQRNLKTAIESIIEGKL